MSVASFANIFSHFEGGFFVRVSFAVQNLLCLIRPHLFILFFIFILGNGSKKKKDLASVYVRVFYPCFPLRVL